jgi:hypothetical protein
MRPPGHFSIQHRSRITPDRYRENCLPVVILSTSNRSSAKTGFPVNLTTAALQLGKVPKCDFSGRWQNLNQPLNPEEAYRAFRALKFESRPSVVENSVLCSRPRAGYPKIFCRSVSLSLDTAQKPYYCGSKNSHQRRLATTALLGLAPARSTRASAANHGKSISACPRDDLGVVVFSRGKPNLATVIGPRNCESALSRVRSVRPLD